MAMQQSGFGGIKQKLVQAALHCREMLLFLGSLVFGFAIAKSVIFEELSPFGVSFLAAVDYRYLFSSLVGAVVGYGTCGDVAMLMRYMASAVLMASVRWFAAAIPGKKPGPMFLCTTALLASFVPGGIIAAASKTAGYDLVLAGCESILCAGGAYFMIRTRPVLKKLQQNIAVSPADMSSAVITLLLFLISITNVPLGAFSLGRLAAVFVILLSALYGKEAGGSISGIAAGIAMSFANSSYVQAAAGYGFGGLLAGVFSVFGRFGIAVAFLLANTITVIIGQPTGEAVTMIGEAAVAATLFMLLPSKWAKQVQAKDLRLADRPEEAQLKDALSCKLEYASRTLEDISETVKKVSQKYGEIAANDISCVFAKAAEKTCRKCPMNLFCHDTLYGETMNVFNDLTPTLRQNGEITCEDLPLFFQSRCTRTIALCENVNSCFTEFLGAKNARGQEKNTGDALADQLKGVGSLLAEISREIGAVEKTDAACATRIKEFFKTMGLCSRVSCLVDEYGRLTAEILMEDSGGLRFNGQALTEELNEATKRIFDSPCISRAGKAVKLTMSERANLAVEIGVCQASCTEGEACGDTADYFLDGKGGAYFQISDGMGSGKKAALDGKMVCSLFARLIKGGFSLESALKTVNAAILAKSEEEALATLDVCRVDLFTGECGFYKAGAPASYVRKGNQVLSMNSSALPIGILSTAEFEKSATRLWMHDMIVMVSDGVLAGGDQWLKSEMKISASQSAAEVAAHLCREAKKRAPTGCEDDITVMVARIEKGV